MKNNKVKFYNIIFLISVILLVYFFGVIYFTNHFYFGTSINGIDISCENIKEVHNKISDWVNNYTLKLEERNNIVEIIEGNDISLQYKENIKIEEIKREQSAFLWPLSIIFKKIYNINEIFYFDKTLFNQIFEKLSCFNKENIIEPLDACFHYNGEEYTIIEEIYGNKVNKEYLYAYILNSLYSGINYINFDEIGAYENPNFTSESKKVLSTKNELDKYVSTNIFYIFDEEVEVLDGSIINLWLEVDQSMNVVFNEKKIKEYINSLSSKYDTFGKSREFSSSTGKVISVSGGNYGWKIDKKNEVEALIENIKNGEKIKKEPMYLQRALNGRKNDIGSTYVEINLTRQYLWFYKNGEVIVQGDVVTGKISNGNATPVGTYSLNYKQKDATLKGAGYSSDVKYWMPFNCNIGIHDASWRGSFGGDIYKNDGSHGCINAPLYLAKKIYENIEAGTPIICYKE